MKYAPPKLEWISDEDHARFRDVVERVVRLPGRAARAAAREDRPRHDGGLRALGPRLQERRAAHPQRADRRHPHGAPRPRARRHLAGGGPRHPARRDDRGRVRAGPDARRCSTTWACRSRRTWTARVLTELFEPDFEAEEPDHLRGQLRGRDRESTTSESSEPYDDAALAENLAGLEALGYVRSAAEEAGGAAPPEGDPRPRSTTTWRASTSAPASSTRPSPSSRRRWRSNPQDADALLGLAGIAAGRGNRARAEHLVKVALATNPDFPPALAQLADLRRDAGDLGECVRLYQQALSLDDASPPLYLGLGDCLQRAARYERGGGRLHARARARPRLLRRPLQPRRHGAPAGAATRRRSRASSALWRSTPRTRWRPRRSTTSAPCTSTSARRTAPPSAGSRPWRPRRRSSRHATTWPRATSTRATSTRRCRCSSRPRASRRTTRCSTSTSPAPTGEGPRRRRLPRAHPRAPPLPRQLVRAARARRAVRRHRTARRGAPAARRGVPPRRRRRAQHRGGLPGARAAARGGRQPAS